MFGKDYQVLDIDYAVTERRRADITQIIELVAFSSYRLFECSVFFYFFLRRSKRQGLYLLWANYPVVDTNIVNQAGPEAASFHSIAGANIYTAFTTFQTWQWCGVLRNLCSINV